jgi:hypothetical protein
MRVAALALPVLLFSFGTVKGEGFAYELSAGVGTSDNVRRVEIDPQEETVATAQLRFSLDERTRRLTADFAGNLAYNEYLDETFESELIGNFAGVGNFALIEDRLFLEGSDYFGQVLGDPLAPANPDNKENLNYLTGGLRANFRMGGSMGLDLSGSYAVATYETAPLDSTNLIWEVGLTRNLATASSLGLRVRHAQLEYDDPLSGAQDYDQGETFLRYLAEAGRTNLTLDAGYTQIDRELAGKDSGVLLRLEATRALSGRSTLTFGAGQEYSNSAAAFASAQTGEMLGLASQSAQQTALPFINRFASLGWNIQGNRTGIVLLGSWNKQVYDDLTFFDQSDTSLAALINRDITPALRADLNLSYGRGKFELRGGDYTDIESSLGFRWQVSRLLWMSFSYAFLDRSSNTTGGDYSDNRFWLMFGTQRGAPRATMRPPRFSSEGSKR